MTLPKGTAAERHDTWEPDWEDRLSRHVRSDGFANVWDYVRKQPGLPYAELAERLAESGDFGVAPIQIERLQVRDTPEAELQASLRDSLARQLRSAFRGRGWGRGAYWESIAMGALGSWSAMWTSRVDLGMLKLRLFELQPPEGWLPADDRDPFLLNLVPEKS